MGIVGPLLLLGGAVLVISKRCEWLGLCGEVGGSSGTTETEATSGGVDESASNLNEQGNFDRSSGAGCCVCEMQGDRVKCQRHGGAWFNPPAGPDGSNDQSVELSLKECNKGCGSNATSPTDRERDEQKAKTSCPSGYTSVNGVCKKSSTVSSQLPRSNRSGSSSSSSNTPRTGNLGEKGTRYVSNPPKATGSATYLNRNAPYKPGQILYTYRSFFVDPTDPRPFTLYHRIAN